MSLRLPSIPPLLRLPSEDGLPSRSEGDETSFVAASMRPRSNTLRDYVQVYASRTGELLGTFVVHVVFGMLLFVGILAESAGRLVCAAVRALARVTFR